ncbi:hypothetical protein SAMN05444371_2293 [Epilithonimonas mollis]|uniref:Transmembrane protein n=1 Tax=Epilithonimonas mollis TaxID=216903 RepID=A0A1M6S743_9FLAO|nr:hypothetical protein SAMN05444371_2293 [Epilithonimonas mollis]
MRLIDYRRIDYRFIIPYGFILLINYQLSIINYQLSIINYQLSIINYQLSIINYQLYFIKCSSPGPAGTNSCEKQ